MLLSGQLHLSNRHDAIDALNVFPVPDGDTSTNMSMTFTSGREGSDAGVHRGSQLVGEDLVEGGC